jgi:ribonuclease P protein component
MLPKVKRLSGPRVKEVLGSGQFKRFPQFMVKTRDNDLGFSRFAVVISKKVSPLAVARNRIKRQILAAVSKNLNRFGSSQDWVFIVGKEFNLEAFCESFDLKSN